MGKAGSGFKKPAGKKKAFSKKDIIYTSLIAAAVVIFIVVLAIVISNDDFIRTKNGRLQMEDNWLIAEYAKKNDTRYYQIGEVGDIEGFTLSTESAGNTLKTYYPDDITDNVAVIFVGATVSNHAEMAAYLTAYTSAAYGCEMPELYETELCGRNAYFACCVTDPVEEETAEGETEETEETADENAAEAEDGIIQPVETDTDLPGCMIYATIEYDDQRCVYIQTNTVEVVTEEDARALVDEIAAAITITDR